MIKKPNIFSFLVTFIMTLYSLIKEIILFLLSTFLYFIRSVVHFFLKIWKSFVFFFRVLSRFFKFLKKQKISLFSLLILTLFAFLFALTSYMTPLHDKKTSDISNSFSEISKNFYEISKNFYEIVDELEMEDFTREIDDLFSQIALKQTLINRSTSFFDEVKDHHEIKRQLIEPESQKKIEILRSFITKKTLFFKNQIQNDLHSCQKLKFELQCHSVKQDFLLHFIENNLKNNSHLIMKKPPLSFSFFHEPKIFQFHKEYSLEKLDQESKEEIW